MLLVESGGADLPRQADVFVPGGEQFRRLTQLSAQGIPTVCVVFGSSTAGGAYLPGMSDYTVMVEDRARVFLGGPPLVKMAIGEDADEEELGGARMHARISGLCDYLARDEPEAIRMARGIVAHLHWRRLGPGPDRAGRRAAVPGRGAARHRVGGRAGALRRARDPGPCRSTARASRSSRSPTAPSWSAAGPPSAATRSASWPTTASSSRPRRRRARSSSRCATAPTRRSSSCRTSPASWSGTRYEQGGIIKDGAKLINAVSNSTVPHLTLMVGASYGAGNYAMAGRAYDPRFVFTWPNHRIAVMGPKQLAGVLSIVRRNAAEAAGPSLRRGGRRGAAPGHRAARSRRSRRRSTPRDGCGTTGSSTRGTPAPCWPSRSPPCTRPPCRAPRSSAWCGTDGTGTIRRLLVANRGEIARRLIRGAHDAGCEAVAVYAADDAGSPHVGEADAAVLLARRVAGRDLPRSAAALVRAARRAGADALHPGYGFLSENPALPEACRGGRHRLGRARRAEAMRVMGHKARAKEMVAAAGVPVLPSAVVAAGRGRRRARRRGRRPSGTRSWSRRRPAAAAAACGSWRDAEELADAVAAAQREAAAAFGSDEVFLERYLRGPAPRRGAGDRGHATAPSLHLLDRECSVQRRHQKVVEEAPAVLVPDARPPTDVGRRGRGGAGRRTTWAPAPSSTWSTTSGFYFLEMNTRLQVEHGVTELVTGLDLVGLQLAVAAGRPLPVRPGRGRGVGHAVEVRLCAERPREDYRPTPGHGRPRALARGRRGSGSTAAIESGSVVSPAYDSLVAKVMAHGEDRAAAVARLSPRAARARARRARDQPGPARGGARRRRLPARRGGRPLPGAPARPPRRRAARRRRGTATPPRPPAACSASGPARSLVPVPGRRAGATSAGRCTPIS